MIFDGFHQRPLHHEETLVLVLHIQKHLTRNTRIVFVSTRSWWAPIQKKLKACDNSFWNPRDEREGDLEEPSGISSASIYCLVLHFQAHLPHSSCAWQVLNWGFVTPRSTSRLTCVGGPLERALELAASRGATAAHRPGDKALTWVTGVLGSCFFQYIPYINK